MKRRPAPLIYDRMPSWLKGRPHMLKLAKLLKRLFKLVSALCICVQFLLGTARWCENWVKRESIRAQLENLRGQELSFQKHREDCSLPSLTQKVRYLAANAIFFSQTLYPGPCQKILQDMNEFYMPLLKELGPARSEQVNEANRMCMWYLLLVKVIFTMMTFQWETTTTIVKKP